MSSGLVVHAIQAENRVVPPRFSVWLKALNSAVGAEQIRRRCETPSVEGNACELNQDTMVQSAMLCIDQSAPGFEKQPETWGDDRAVPLEHR